MFKNLFSCSLIAFVLAIAPFAFAGKVELTTYYPAPFGEYQELKAQKSTVTGTGTTNDTIAFQAGGLNTVSPGTVPPGLVVTNANNVGIGTTSPGVYGGQQSRLDVNGYTAADDVYLKAPKTGSPRWASQATSGVSEIKIWCGYACAAATAAGWTHAGNIDNGGNHICWNGAAFVGNGDQDSCLFYR